MGVVLRKHAHLGAPGVPPARGDGAVGGRGGGPGDYWAAGVMGPGGRFLSLAGADHALARREPSTALCFGGALTRALRTSAANGLVLYYIQPARSGRGLTQLLRALPPGAGCFRGGAPTWVRRPVCKSYSLLPTSATRIFTSDPKIGGMQSSVRHSAHTAASHRLCRLASTNGHLNRTVRCSARLLDGGARAPLLLDRRDVLKAVATTTVLWNQSLTVAQASGQASPGGAGAQVC